MFVVPLYQMLPDQASHVQANLYSEQANAGRLGKNKICVFASQEVEERPTYDCAELRKTQVNESGVGCLLAQTSAQADLPHSSCCRCFYDAQGTHYHACTAVTKDMS